MSPAVCPVIVLTLVASPCVLVQVESGSRARYEHVRPRLSTLMLMREPEEERCREPAEGQGGCNEIDNKKG